MSSTLAANVYTCFTARLLSNAVHTKRLQHEHSSSKVDHQGAILSCATELPSWYKSSCLCTIGAVKHYPQNMITRVLGRAELILMHCHCNT